MLKAHYRPSQTYTNKLTHVFMILILVSSHSELFCQVCVTALTVNCIEVYHMLKAHYRPSQSCTHKLTKVFMIAVIVSSHTEVFCQVCATASKES